MGVIRKSTATVILVLLAVACGSPFSTSIGTVSTAGTTVTIGGDSEWQIPSGFSVVLPPTRFKLDAMSSNYVGDPSDIPDFTMTRKSESDKELDSVLIAVYSDGVSAEANPKVVLMSWTESIQGAEYAALVVTDGISRQVATWRGQAQSVAQSSPQGIIVTVVSDLETQRVWRMFCIVSSEETSDDVARICYQVEADFRPL